MEKLKFQQPLILFSVSHDPSEMIPNAIDSFSRDIITPL